MVFPITRLPWSNPIRGSSQLTERGEADRQIADKESEGNGENWPVDIAIAPEVEFSDIIFLVRRVLVDKRNKEGGKATPGSAYAARTGNLQYPGDCVHDTTTPLTAIYDVDISHSVCSNRHMDVEN